MGPRICPALSPPTRASWSTRSRRPCRFRTQRLPELRDIITRRDPLQLTTFAEKKPLPAIDPISRQHLGTDWLPARCGPCAQHRRRCCRAAELDHRRRLRWPLLLPLSRRVVGEPRHKESLMGACGWPNAIEAGDLTVDALSTTRDEAAAADRLAQPAWPETSAGGGRGRQFGAKRSVR